MLLCAHISFAPLLFDFVHVCTNFYFRICSASSAECLVNFASFVNFDSAFVYRNFYFRMFLHLESNRCRISCNFACSLLILGPRTTTGKEGRPHHQAAAWNSNWVQSLCGLLNFDSDQLFSVHNQKLSANKCRFQLTLAGSSRSRMD